ncbi:MAG: hypothetical protein ACRC4N_02480 [Gammaproteobacteria bacterium]
MNFDSMSRNLTDLLKKLSKNDTLCKLLLNASAEPLKDDIPKNTYSEIIRPSSESARIFPYPFAEDSTDKDKVFLRVYYNNGALNENETIGEAQIHIDIVCAKSLWLIRTENGSSIRPYEIMSRVMDSIGKKSIGSGIKVSFERYQHLYVNQQFDAIRLYANYMTIETQR